MKQERHAFRTVRWVLWLIAGSFVVNLLASVGLLRSEGPTATTLGLAGLAAFFGVALVESMVARVILEPDQLKIVSNFRRIVIPRSDLVRAVAEKGSPIALERVSGGWIRLPSTLTGPHINTLRSWLKGTTGPADSSPRA